VEWLKIYKTSIDCQWPLVLGQCWAFDCVCGLGNWCHQALYCFVGIPFSHREGKSILFGHLYCTLSSGKFKLVLLVVSVSKLLPPWCLCSGLPLTLTWCHLHCHRRKVINHILRKCPCISSKIEVAKVALGFCLWH
jgi:hypothetical protein